MRKKYLLSFWVVLVLLLVAQSGWCFDLTILHINDSHSYLDTTNDKLSPGGEATYVKLGAWARLQTAVDSVRGEKENVMLLHAGDAVQGDLYFMKYSGRPEMEFLNRLDFDAMTLGNHEFDKGADFLVAFLKYTTVPIVCANIDASGKPKLASKLKPYIIISYGKEKVGIIGLTTKDTAFISSPGPGVTFADEAETARKYVKELEDMGINKIILLTHVGLDRDKVLAATVPGVDIIVGGHSHSLLGDPDAMKAIGETVDGTYPVVVKGADGGDVYVVTAWKWGRVLGQMDVTFDDSGHITAVEGKPVLLLADDFKQKNEAGKKVQLEGAKKEKVVTAIAASPVAEIVATDRASVAFLKPFTDGVQAMRNDIIGVATKRLSHIRVPGVTDSGLSLPHGSLLAPIVCQAVLDKVNSMDKRVDMALENAGVMRRSIAQGNITVGTAYMVLPFGNTLVILKLSGAQIRSELEFGVTQGGGQFPYMAGARYIADMTKPKGKRITSVDVMTKNGKWQPLDSGRIYSLVTNSYLASGGGGYAIFKQAKDRYDTGFMETLAFIEYVKKKKKIAPSAFTGVTYLPAK